MQIKTKTTIVSNLTHIYGNSFQSFSCHQGWNSETNYRTNRRTIPYWLSCLAGPPKTRSRAFPIMLRRKNIIIPPKACFARGTPDAPTLYTPLPSNWRSAKPNTFITMTFRGWNTFLAFTLTITNFSRNLSLRLQFFISSTFLLRVYQNQ